MRLFTEGASGLVAIDVLDDVILREAEDFWGAVDEVVLTGGIVTIEASIHVFWEGFEGFDKEGAEVPVARTGGTNEVRVLPVVAFLGDVEHFDLSSFNRDETSIVISQEVAVFFFDLKAFDDNGGVIREGQPTITEGIE